MKEQGTATLAFNEKHTKQQHISTGTSCHLRPFTQFGVCAILALSGTDPGIAILPLVPLQLIEPILPLLHLRLTLGGSVIFVDLLVIRNLLGTATGRRLGGGGGAALPTLRLGSLGLLTTGDGPFKADLFKSCDALIGKGSLLALPTKLVHLPLTVNPLTERGERTLTNLAGTDAAVTIFCLVSLELFKALLPWSTGRDEGLELKAKLFEGGDALPGHGRRLPRHPRLEVLTLLADPQSQAGGVLLRHIAVAILLVVGTELFQPFIPRTVTLTRTTATAGIELPIERDGFE
mmetsp:Transcript_4000/g.7845  ORF Transcript_4000/g.7845 Transcript_4000/m.7845 type:complete len:291 (+) Transcript_4000:766-1638(+)